jgi:SAM-dependent methyltransferase
VSGATPAATTWHHGLVARWWALFNVDGPEIDCFRRYVEAGQPALDLACGTGRLLVPYVAAGLDVDGTDVSADMLAYCRAAAGAVGAAPTLTVQANHELDMPRRYRTIYCCGGFGLGTTAEHDAESLRRVYDHLLPGGTFVVDNEVADTDPATWARWAAAAADDGADPEPPAATARRRGPDGDEYALTHRIVAVDEGARRGVRAIHAWRWRDGTLIASERHELVIGAYTRDELEALLRQTGFVDVEVTGGYDGAPPGPEHRFLVYTARRPGGANDGIGGGGDGHEDDDDRRTP